MALTSSFSPLSALLFELVTAWAQAQIVIQWREQKLGVKMNWTCEELSDDCTSYENYLSELFFADDETLLASKVDDLQTMLSQVQI